MSFCADIILYKSNIYLTVSLAKMCKILLFENFVLINFHTFIKYFLTEVKIYYKHLFEYFYESIYLFSLENNETPSSYFVLLTFILY